MLAHPQTGEVLNARHKYNNVATMHSESATANKSVNPDHFSKEAAQVISRAANAYNLGLRSYYFALALIVWFVSWWGFMAAATLVVWVLYRREFKSKVLKALMRPDDVKILNVGKG